MDEQAFCCFVEQTHTSLFLNKKKFNKHMSEKSWIPRSARGKKGQQKGKPEFLRRTDIDQRAHF